MTDPFVPEADALEQRQEVTPARGRSDNDENAEPKPALEYPERLPAEASEADALEQNQTVEFDDDREWT
jgi:hypothetical protein